MAWHLGNLHCHSTNSDGDSAPAEVARFYREAGYQFVAITDHNRITSAADCGTATSDFVVLPGSEYTSHVGPRQCHVNGIGVTRAIAPVGDSADVVATLQAGVDQALAQGAFAMMNHPNWHWSYGAAEMAAVRGAHAFELWNGGPSCNSAGAPGRDSTEAMWDSLLTRGVRIWGVASDDCHRFKPERKLGWDPPFTGWVSVEAERLDGEALVRGLIAGRFYASTGIFLKDPLITRDEIGIEVYPLDQTVFWTTFIGAGGRVLDVQQGSSARYRPRGDEGYVRTRVDSAAGARAWLQPVFLD